MAPSFPPSSKPGGRYNLRSKRPPMEQASPDIPPPVDQYKGRKTAWSRDRLRTFVDMLVKEKSNSNWEPSKKDLKEGWPVFLADFNKTTGANFIVSQLKGKLEDLVTQYEQYKKESDPECDQNERFTAEARQKTRVKPVYRKPPCFDQLQILFGPRYIGEIMCCGSRGYISSTHAGSTSKKPSPKKSSSKKRASPAEVDSPGIRRSIATVKEVANYVKSSAKRVEEKYSAVDEAFQLLAEDGITPEDEWHSRAVVLFSWRPWLRKYFLHYCPTPEARRNFLEEKWTDRMLERQKLRM